MPRAASLSSCLLAAVAAAALCLPAVSAVAQMGAGDPSGGIVPGDPTAPATDAEPAPPSVLSADEIVNDEELGLVIARGNVEILTDARTIRADTISFNQRTGIVTASGNVVLAEPTGEVYFADYAELTEDLADGFIQGLGVRMQDSSRIAGATADRRDGRVLTVTDAVYSPCRSCEENPERPVLWQLQASETTHDNVTRDIVFRNATLDMFGLPVLYTPYFSMPDPTVRQRSGLLSPLYGSDSNIGGFYRQSYYWAISPSQDATFTLQPTTEKGLMGAGEYRRRWENARVSIQGSYNNSGYVEETANGNVERDDQHRWHIFADGIYEVDDNWRVTNRLRRSSDDSYANIFNFSDEDVLTSNVRAEGFFGLNYVSADLYAFQDTRERTIDQPYVTPWVRADHLGEPGDFLGGQTVGHLSMLGLLRTDDGINTNNRLSGADTARLVGELGWQRTHYSGFGLVSDFQIGLTNALWLFDDVPDFGPPFTRDSGAAFRTEPRASAEFRYPVARRIGTIQQVIEPIAAFTAAPDFDFGEIPNNDGVEVELDDVGLFSSDRLPGYDRTEGGFRATYGIRFGFYGDRGGESSFFLGQSVTTGDTDVFPNASGLENAKSDLVGRVRIQPNDFFNLDYGFRVDEDTGEFGRHDVNLEAGIPGFRVNSRYISVVNTPAVGDVEQLRTGVSSRINNFWTARASTLYDFEEGGFTTIAGGVTYEDECFIFDVAAERELSDDPNEDDGVSVLARLTLKTVADIPLPGFNL